MHLYFEKNLNAKSDSTLLALSWMGKVPDETPEEDGWKLDRTNYYQEGWLACGNVHGIVGVTFTTCHCKKLYDAPSRSNFNLRGHRSEVILVKWNEPYQKLATCDANGIIFVWIKYEGRWSIELINDRNVQVTDFAWSHDGRMALICYKDGFVLVGSVAGQRFWSSMLNLESTITCGAWTPDDQQVYFGTSDGQLIVMDINGAMVGQVTLADDVEIVAMAWSCEKFKMDETDGEEPLRDMLGISRPTGVVQQPPSVLAVCFKNGNIHMVRSYDDISPNVINTQIKDCVMEWSNSGDVLAVGGMVNAGTADAKNVLKFYTDAGHLRYSAPIPDCQRQVSALTWGHNDKRLFIATGCIIHTAWVTRKVSSLQLLSKVAIRRAIQEEGNVQRLPLPPRLRQLVGNLFSTTIKGHIPHPHKLREFTIATPPRQERLYCTMIRSGDDITASSTYTLYLEYLGGLVPLLRGRRVSKIRPEFVIYDPKIQAADDDTEPSSNRDLKDSSSSSSDSDSSQSDLDRCGSPRVQRERRKLRRRRRPFARDQSPKPVLAEHEAWDADMLPQEVKMAEVTSNIWGTRFKIVGVASYLPTNLGQVNYKTSLLHLQPRQMAILITELRDDLKPEKDPNFCAATFSDDDDTGASSCVDTDVLNPGIPTASPVPIAPIMFTSGHSIKSHNTEDGSLQAEVHRIGLSDDVTEVTNVLPDDTAGSSQTVFLEKNIVNKANASCQANIPLDGAAAHDLDLNLPHVVSATADSLTSHQMQNVVSESTSLCHTDMRTRDSGHACHVIQLIDRLNDNSESSSSLYYNGNSSTSPSSHIAVHSTAETSLAMATKPVVETCDTEDDIESLGKVLGGCQTDDNDSKAYSDLALDSAGSSGTSSVDISGKLAAESSKELNNSSACVNDAGNGSDAAGVFTVMNTSITTWAEQSGKIEYIDAQEEEKSKSRTTSLSLDVRTAATRRSRSVGQLHMFDSGALVMDFVATPLINTDKQKRLVLKPSIKPELKHYGKSKSLDSSIWLDVGAADTTSIICAYLEKQSAKEASKSSGKDCASLRRLQSVLKQNSQNVVEPESDSAKLIKSRDRTPEVIHSAPPSPAHGTNIQKSKGKLGKKHKKGTAKKLRRRSKSADTASSEDELSAENVTSRNYKNLQSFQKSHIKQKMRKVKKAESASGTPIKSPKRLEFAMHNKAPLWNETNQVYQLDFGGRVTQESAKNFQVEFKGKQVMQFGRIDGNAYTLDFQYPFTAVQAFAVALANVTQRLK